MIDMQALLALLDDDALVRKYLQNFAADMPGLLIQMKEACDSQLWNEISIQAHIYKCQMQYINEPDGIILAYELEKMSASPSPEKVQIESLIIRLEDGLVNILKEIQEIIE